jgi:protocatechuate 3,4-dioxygenase beta subunit
MDKLEPWAKTNRNQPAGGGQPTHEIEEGPYYKPGSPPKTRLYEEGIVGDKLSLTGSVFDHNGQPIAHSWLDFWQADGKGVYDSAGFKLRGHQYTDSSGKYGVETVVPGDYVGRTPHIHVKVRANSHSPVFTTQLFIPGLSSNKADFLYREDLLIALSETPQGKKATFNFVLKD